MPGVPGMEGCQRPWWAGCQTSAPCSESHHTVTARILVVDDVLPNLRLLEAKLSAEYFEVATAANGPRALELASAWLPDIVLLDVMMPGMDGYEVCRRLKADPATEHLPVVMVTALNDPSERIRGLEVGADDFLTKPVEDMTLFARVRSLVRLKRLLDEWRLRSSTTLEVGMKAAQPSFQGARAVVLDEDELEAARIAAALAADGIETLRLAGAARDLSSPLLADAELVILSLTLAEADPLRLAGQLRADQRTRETPLLLLADEHQRGLLVRGIDLGANDYVIRPIEDGELRARARNQLRRRFYQERLRADLNHTLALAVTDGLTGLYNHRYLMGHLRAMIQPGRPVGTGFALLMVDVDRFKSLNDTHGHSSGDTALREVAAALRANVRVFDTIARYGGEEFVVIMPGAGTDEGEAVAERLRRTVEALQVRTETNRIVGITISVGVTAIGTHSEAPEGPEPHLELLKRADQALYRAKREGRNRVVVGEAA